MHDGDVRVATKLAPEIAAEAAAALRGAQDGLREAGLRLQKPHLPIRVAVVSTVFELASLSDGGAPGLARTRAVSLVGRDANYVALAWHAPGSPTTALAHELAHLAEPTPDEPLWLREGRAEYFALRHTGSLDGTINRLRVSDWMPLLTMRFAERPSAAASNWTFYPQAWLTVDWLVSRGADPATVSDRDLGEAVDELGVDGVETALREHFDSLPPETEAEEPHQADPSGTVAAEAPGWVVDLVLAAFERERGDTQRAADRLRPLFERFADEPAVAAELGALEMDLKRYGRAEELLRIAAEDPEATARTRRRYALLLLLPTDRNPRRRAVEAADHARRALEERPHGSYRLTLAQAEMVAGRWAESERLLNELAQDPEYAGRIPAERETLRLLQTQAMRDEAPPAAAPEAPPVLEANSPAGEIARPAPPPKPRWPPPGVTVVAGRIDVVDCSGAEKVVVLKSPLFPMRFREPRGRPASIHTPPYKEWKTIPCQGASGLYVNLAYKPAKKLGGRYRGEVVAILF